MDVGYLDRAYHWMAGPAYRVWKLRPDARILAYACKSCGYVEFYLEKKGAKS